MKKLLSSLFVIAFSVFTTGCATATLDITVDVFEKNPAVDLPLSDRKVEAMLQDLTKLQENADQTLAVKNKLATGTAALYDDALKMLLDAGKFKDGQLPLPATVSCPVVPEVETNDPKESPDDDVTQAEHVSALKAYRTCLEIRYEQFIEARRQAVEELLTYLKVYKRAYSVIATQQCKELINSEKATTNKICDNPETFIKYLDTELEMVSSVTTKPFRKHKTKEVEVLKKHKYLFGKINTAAKFRDLRVNLKDVKNKDADITICKSYDRDECVQSFVDLEVNTLNKVSEVVAAFKQLNLPAIYFNWGNIEFLINKHIEVRPGSALLWKNFARQLQRKLIALNEEAGVQPTTGHRSISRSFDDTSFQGASMTLANELEALRNDLPESASSRTALEGLVKSKSNLNDLIDRLQNAGDPVWRTIVNPAFANQWHTINEQHFKGDGNTSVVVIRDNPTRFRTAQAKNDPTVLAENQIRISSAVTEAALNVVGGFSGFGKVNLQNGNAEQEQTSEAGRNDALALDIDAQKTVIRNLKSELALLLAEINSLPDGADARKVDLLRQSALARISAYADALTLAEADNDD